MEKEKLFILLINRAAPPTVEFPLKIKHQLALNYQVSLNCKECKTEYYSEAMLNGMGKKMGLRAMY